MVQPSNRGGGAAGAFSLGVTILFFVQSVSLAGEFNVAAKPAIVTLKSNAGARLTHSIELVNQGAEPAEIAVSTADWQVDHEGEMAFSDALLPGSCRPWVSLERAKVKVAPRSSQRYRFQIDVPADAPAGECRFMLMVQAAVDPFVAAMEARGMRVQLPIQGRIGIPVYAALGGAKPALELLRTYATATGSGPQIRLELRNTGTAHARLTGALVATDDAGSSYNLIPTRSTILAGQTMYFSLTPEAPRAGGEKPKVILPVRVAGQFDYGIGEIRVNTEISQNSIR